VEQEGHHTTASHGIRRQNHGMGVDKTTNSTRAAVRHGLDTNKLAPSPQLAPQKHRAVLWTFANLVLYRMQRQRTLTLHNYLDFLRRAKLKNNRTKLLSFTRTQARVVTGLLTGHNTLRRHLFLLCLANSPACRGCGVKEETSAHVLCECEAWASLTHI
jgi:hypothetical protein